MKILQILLSVFLFILFSQLVQADPDNPKKEDSKIDEQQIKIFKEQYELASSKDSTKETKTKAFENLEKKSYERSVDNEVYYYLGLCYLNGYGTKINTNKADDIFSRGAIAGNIRCLLRGQEMHKEQFEIASSKNSTEEMQGKAFAKIKNSDYGAIDKEFYYYMGMCYLNGYGTKVSLEDAYKCFAQGSKNGNNNCLLKQSEMQKNQFEIASSKESTGEIKKGAFNYLLKRSYEKPIDKEVYYYIGLCHLNGYGTTISAEDAYSVFRTWGKEGNSNCLLMQGVMHEKEISLNEIKLNPTEAIKYYEQAAALGNLEAKKKIENFKTNNNNDEKFLLDTFGEAYAGISFGASSNSLRSKLLSGDEPNLRPYETSYNGSEPYIWKNLNSVLKSKGSNLEAFSVIYNFSPTVITYETSTVKLEFLVCEDKKAITNESIKKNELGLYFVSLKYKNIENNEIIKKLKEKYQGIKEFKTDLTVSDKTMSVLGVKELVLSVPTMTYQDDKVNLIYYSLPKEINNLITIKNTPISELSENDIKVLTDQMQKYEKDMAAKILAVKNKNPEKDIDEYLKEQKIKLKFKDIAEFRDYIADLTIRDIPTSHFSRMIKDLGLTLNSNVLYITSVKIQNIIVEESIKINNDKK